MVTFIILLHIGVRKCEYCNRYFLPFSSLSLYCGRLIDDESGKTCKDIAGAKKYLDKVQSDEIAKIYAKNSKAYHMRCNRVPDYYHHDGLAKWRENAKLKMKLYKEGEITEQEVLQALELPKTK